jgi:putative PIN family toxin of toxin-antitoxin system
MKIVLDTNVLVSALIKEGKPRQLLFKIIKSRHQLITSMKILEELAVVTDEPKIRTYVSEEDVADFLRDIAMASKMVEVKSSLKVIKEDPDDNTILNTAVDAKASYIVSGDQHLLDLKRYRRARIVSVEEMFRII